MHKNNCPLENNLEFTKLDNKTVKHLRKCPLFLKYLCQHFFPFYFPRINDSFYLLENKDVRQVIREFCISLKNVLELVVNQTGIITYDEFLFLKYEILLYSYLQDGRTSFIANVHDGTLFADKVRERLSEKRHREKEDNTYSKEYSLENFETSSELVLLHLEKIKKEIIQIRKRTQNQNHPIHDHGPTTAPVNHQSNKEKEKEILEYQNIVDIEKQSFKGSLPLFTLKYISVVHRLKIVRHIMHYIDTHIFKETNNMDRTNETIEEKEESYYDKDKILSIAIYLTIYISCKMNMLKRKKSKQQTMEPNDDSNNDKENSIHYFLDHLDKHDIQNINMLFLLLYFNEEFYKMIEQLFQGKRDFFISKVPNLFIDLGGGKGSTSRWIHFMMNYLINILHSFWCNEPKSGINGICKILIIEKASMRNKKEKKDFQMQIDNNENKNIMRIKLDICDFHLCEFIKYATQTKREEQVEIDYFIPDIVYFYYYKKVVKQNDEVYLEGKKDEEENYLLKTVVQHSTEFRLLCTDFMNTHFMFLEKYFHMNIKKLKETLTQGNHNILKVYDKMEDFLKNLDCKNIIFLTKHFCGNATDMAIKMLINQKNQNLVNQYFVIVPCCHHRCDVHRIMGFQYLNSMGIDIKHFQHVVHHMSGYASSCNNKIKRNLGKNIKLLIDLTRLLALLQAGLENTYLIKFVSRKITLESYALVYFNKKKIDLTNFKSF